MLKHAVNEYVTFYNSERPHQGIEQRKPSEWSFQDRHVIAESPEVNRPTIKVSRRLGGFSSITTVMSISSLIALSPLRVISN